MISNDVFFIVLLAALLNAGWNSAIKIGGDRLSVMAITTLIGSGISLCALPWVTMPARESWGLLALSVAIHTVYHLVLPIAYRHGDLGQVYPIARGSAPLLVVIGGVVLAGEWPGTGALLGVVVLSGGVLALGLGGRAHSPGASRRPVGYALLTGLLIAAYTVVDVSWTNRHGVPCVGARLGSGEADGSDAPRKQCQSQKPAGQVLRLEQDTRGDVTTFQNCLLRAGCGDVDAVHSQAAPDGRGRAAFEVFQRPLKGSA